MLPCIIFSKLDIHSLAMHYVYATCFCRVFAAIIFGAMAMGQAAHFAPDAGKAQEAAGRVFMLLDEVPKIDSYSQDGDQLVSLDIFVKPHQFFTHQVAYRYRTPQLLTWHKYLVGKF